MRLSSILSPLVSLLRERYDGKWMLLAGLVIVAFFTMVSILAPFIAPYEPAQISVPLELASEPQPPSWEHPMGTNNIGYDVFSRILYGGRVILYVVLSASILSLSIGVPLGLVSGYYSGKVDRILSMVMDSIYSFPGIILAIAIASVLGTSPTNAAIALAVVYVPTYFRMVRGQTLKLAQSVFVEALRSLGYPDRVILLRHILPNTAPVILVVFGLGAADAILTEAGLSFFGLTVSNPNPDWGFDLYNGMGDFRNGYWWTVFFPGLMIMLLALGFALIGEGLAEKLALRVERD
ncbi:MAG: ABC transporter permease [Desulfurococcales archaeon]|nr:ABC transporter permease [Desulfurococcales archaeon]